MGQLHAEPEPVGDLVVRHNRHCIYVLGVHPVDVNIDCAVVSVILCMSSGGIGRQLTLLLSLLEPCNRSVVSLMPLFFRPQLWIELSGTIAGRRLWEYALQRRLSFFQGAR